MACLRVYWSSRLPLESRFLAVSSNINDRLGSTGTGVGGSKKSNKMSKVSDSGEANGEDGDETTGLGDSRHSTITSTSTHTPAAAAALQRLELNADNSLKDWEFEVGTCYASYTMIDFFLK